MSRKSSVPRQSMARPSTSRQSTSRQSMAGRPSTSGLARPSISRQSSVGGMGRPSTAGRAVKVDVKVNLNSNIKYMLNHLTENSYPQTLSRKNLVNPTEATFKEVFQFILSTLSPNFDMKRIGTAVPEFLIALGYPYAMKESHFKPVGSPHNWPYVLEALVWLTKFASMSDYERENASTLLTLECQDKAADDELWHITESNRLYKRFNNGGSAMEDLLSEYKTSRNSEMRCAVKSEENEELRRRIEALTMKKSGHDTKQKKLQTNILDNQKQLESVKNDVIAIEEMRKQKQKDRVELEQAAEVQQKEREALMESMERYKLQQTGLERVIAQQPPQLEVQKSKQRMKLLKEQRNALKADVDKKSGECWKAEIEDSNAQLKIREDFRQVEESLGKVVPKHCINMEGAIDNRKLVQVRSTLSTVLDQSKVLREEQTKTGHQLYKEQVQLQELQEDYNLLIDNVKSKASQRKYKEEDNERSKQKMIRASARLDEDVERCRKRVNELKTELNVNLDISTVDEKLIVLLAEIDSEKEREEILYKMSLLKKEELQGASASYQFTRNLLKLFKNRSSKVMSMGS